MPVMKAQSFSTGNIFCPSLHGPRDRAGRGPGPKATKPWPDGARNGDCHTLPPLVISNTRRLGAEDAVALPAKDTGQYAPTSPALPHFHPILTLLLPLLAGASLSGEQAAPLPDLAALQEKFPDRSRPLTWVITGDLITQGAKWLGAGERSRGHTVTAHVLDQSDEVSILRLRDWVQTEFGRVDGLSITPLPGR